MRRRAYVLAAVLALANAAATAQTTTAHLAARILPADAPPIDSAVLIERGGEGKSFDFVDVSSGQRRAVTVRQLGDEATKQPDTAVAVASKAVLADDPAHPDHPTFNRIQEWVRGTGHWDDAKSLNISSALYREVANSPLVKRVDSVMGGVGQDGSENVFAIHAPFGDKGPFFRAQVDGREAGQQPAQQNLQQAETIKQDRAQSQGMEQQQGQEQARAMQPTR